jgi:outer membrane lipoprotein-sorting protein
MERNFVVSKFKDSVGEAAFRLVNAGGQERLRDSVGWSKLRPNGVDNARLTRFTAPADIKGTATLLVENSAGDDDIWIYLPALKKVRRLVASNKKDSFVGTDFSYGDVIGHKVGDWRHKLLREETVDGAACYVVESVPATPEIKTNSGYSKRIGWFRKDNFVAIKGEAFDEGGELLKRVSATDVRLLDPASGRWQPMRLEALNVQTGHRTVIEFRNQKVNQGIGDEFFTTRYLERER